MRRILIATEGSPCSLEALKQFIALYPIWPAEVFVLSVVPDAERAHQQRIETGTDEALEALDQAIAELTQAEVKACYLTRVGSPADVIVDTAKEVGAHLIVLGTHGRQGLERLLHGSVAEKVLRKAPCGVVIFPYSHVEEQEAATA